MEDGILKCEYWDSIWRLSYDNIEIPFGYLIKTCTGQDYRYNYYLIWNNSGDRTLEIEEIICNQRKESDAIANNQLLNIITDSTNNQNEFTIYRDNFNTAKIKTNDKIYQFTEEFNPAIRLCLMGVIREMINNLGRDQLYNLIEGIHRNRIKNEFMLLFNFLKDDPISKQQMPHAK
jgi:hypothetical protein